MKIPFDIQRYINYIPANDGRGIVENRILELLRENEKLIAELSAINLESINALKEYMK